MKPIFQWKEVWHEHYTVYWRYPNWIFYTFVCLSTIHLQHTLVESMSQWIQWGHGQGKTHFHDSAGRAASPTNMIARKVQAQEKNPFNWTLVSQTHCRLLWLFEVFCISIQIVKLFVLALWKNFSMKNSLVLSLLYGPPLISVHNYWKNYSSDNMDLCQQSDASTFYVLSRFVIAFLPRSKPLLI